MSLLVPARRPARELLDDQSLPQEEMARSLQDLELVNARWGGGGALADWLLARTRPGETPPVILDVGAGSGGVSRSVAARLAAHGVAAQVVAVDLQWRPLAFGRARRPGLVGKEALDNRSMLDLRRHLFPWIFVSIAGRMVFESAASKHDGPASVLQAYTPSEAEAIARSAVPEARVERVFPYRMLVTGPPL